MDWEVHVDRIIEKEKTYRIQYGQKGYSLLRVISIGKSKLKILDLKTDKTHEMSRSRFQKLLNSGDIAVSAGHKPEYALTIDEVGPYSAVLARDDKSHKFVDFVATIDGVEVGKLQVIIDREDKLLEANNIKVKPEYRRLGIATMLYRHASKYFGGKSFVPSASQSDDGAKLWESM